MLQGEPIRLILASASPRRRLLLAEAGYQFDIEPPDVDETALAAGIPADALPRRLAEAKAGFVAAHHAGRRVVVLGADTVVYGAQGEVLGKPLDRADAGRMLRALSGSLHRVVTAVCCIRCDDGRERSTQVRSDVLMRPLSEAEIEAYLDTGEWEGKAGGYGIQDTPGRNIGEGDPFIESIGGELTNIVGLPMPQVIDLLDELGVAAQERRGSFP
jgi:septum formation protein